MAGTTSSKATKESSFLSLALIAIAVIATGLAIATLYASVYPPLMAKSWVLDSVSPPEEFLTTTLELKPGGSYELSEAAIQSGRDTHVQMTSNGQWRVWGKVLHLVEATSDDDDWTTRRTYNIHACTADTLVLAKDGVTFTFYVQCVEAYRSRTMPPDFGRK